MTLQVLNNRGPGGSCGGPQKCFKATMDGTEGRKHREETSIQLRKAKKDEILRKRRAGIIGTNGNGNTAIVSSQNEIDLEIKDCVTIFQKWMSCGKIISPTTVPEDDLTNAIKRIRRMLSVENEPPVQQIINSGSLYFLTELLLLKDSPVILFETTWALTNIASSNYTNSVIDQLYLVDRLVPLIIHDSPAVREQSAWCIGNIAGDKYEYRDALLKNDDIVNGLLINLNQPDSHTLLQNICWTISNLCRGKNPQPPASTTRVFLQPLFNVINLAIESVKNNNIDCQLNDLITDAMWCLTYLSDGDNSRIQIVLDDCRHKNAGETVADAADGSTTIVECIKEIFILHKNSTDDGIHRGLLIPCVRLLGNIVSGTNEQTSVVVDSGILKYLDELLDHPSKALRKEVCWMLSNIAAGTEDHIWSIFHAEKHCDLIRSIIDKASSSEPINVRKEAIWTISNIVTTGCHNQYKLMVQYDCIDPLCEILSYSEDSKLILVSLQALEVILQYNERDNTMHDQVIESYGGVEAMEKLQEHQCNDVYEKAVHLLETYYNATEENNADQNLVPTTISGENDTTAFQFSAPKELFPSTVSGSSNQQQQQLFFNFGSTSATNA